jgi:3-oxoacyl-ACP reductase-like protein
MSNEVKKSEEAKQEPAKEAAAPAQAAPAAEAPKAEAAPAPKLAGDLFKQFTLGSTLKQGPVGNVMTTRMTGEDIKKLSDKK